MKQNPKTIAYIDGANLHKGVKALEQCKIKFVSIPYNLFERQ